MFVCQGGRNCQGAGLFTPLYQTPIDLSRYFYLQPQMKIDSCT